MLPRVKYLVLTCVLVIVLSVVLTALPGCKSTPEPEPEPEVSPSQPAPPVSEPETSMPEPEPETPVSNNPEPEPVPEPELPQPPAPPPAVGLDALGLPEVPLGEKRLDVEKIYSGGDGPGLCYLGSYAMLARYADGNIEFSDVIAASGVGVSAVYIPEVNLLMNGYSIGSIGAAAVNQGFSYFIGGLKGAQITDEFFASNLTRDAVEVLAMESEDAAYDLLKRVISAGIPVMVHLDITLIKEDLIANSSYMMPILMFSGSGHIDHYMTVNGYDGDFVYLNDPTEPEEGMGKDIPVDIGDFLEAWENGNNPAIEEGARIGPCWMLFLGKRGTPKSAEELIAWNKDIAVGAPNEIRKAAERPNIIPLLHCTEMGRARLEFGMFLKENGYTEAGEIFMEISELFRGLERSPNQRADLQRIADLQEEVVGEF